MRVLVLTAGRTGSLAFAEACRHITNYTSGHETRVGLIGDERLAYPDQHIEVDDRLAWFPGRLEEAFGDDAFYVHLRRDEQATAASRARRWNKPLMRAYRNGILWDVDPACERIAVARDLNRTVDSNIRYFLRDKTRTMSIDIETATETFPLFWERIGAEGDLEAAMAEFDAQHHEGTSQRTTPRPSQRSTPRPSQRSTSRPSKRPQGSRGWRAWLPGGGRGSGTR